MTVIATGFDGRRGARGPARVVRGPPPAAAPSAPEAAAATRHGRGPALLAGDLATTRSTSRRSCATDRSHARRRTLASPPRPVASLVRPCRRPPRPCAARRSTTATRRRARSSSPSPAGRCPSSTRASARSTSPCARGAGVFDVSHMGEVETQRPGGARSSSSACSPTTSSSRGRRRAVLRALPRGRRRARRPLHLPPGADRYLTVTNASNHERDFAWLADHAPRASTSRSTTPLPTTRCSPSRARARASRSGGLIDGRGCRRGCARRATVAGCELPRLRHRLHGRGRRRDPDPAGRRRPRSGTRCSPRARRPPASARATRCGWRSASTSTATTSRRTATRSRPGLGWCCKLDTGLHRRRARCASVGRPQTLAPFAFTGPGIPRQGNAVLVDGAGAGSSRAARSRRASSSGSAWPTFPSQRDARHADRDRRARASGAPPRCARSRSTRRRAESWPKRATPRNCCTTPSTTGPRIEGDTATFGITWYAQDALGEVVFFDPPEVGTTVRRTSPTPRSSRSRRSRTSIAPLSGEIVEVNEALADAPENINADPYGDGWLVEGQAVAIRSRGRRRCSMPPPTRLC